MSSVTGIEICPLTSVKGGEIDFYTPQTSHETMLVEVPPGTIDDLFVHKSQTDQLLVVKGRFSTRYYDQSVLLVHSLKRSPT